MRAAPDGRAWARRRPLPLRSHRFKQQADAAKQLTRDEAWDAGAEGAALVR